MITSLNSLIEKKAVLILLLFLSLQIPSVRVLFKYIPNNYHFIIAIYAILSLLFYYLLVTTRISRNYIFIYPVLSFLLFILIIGANYYLYPIADSLKYQMKGSDSDDAIIVVVKALFSGHSPYAVETYFHNPPSPGPGLILIMAPFVIFNAYYIATPFFLFLLSFLLYRLYKEYKAVAVFLLVIISSPAFWELMINGSDLLIIGVLMIIPVLLWTKCKSFGIRSILLVLIAMVLTSRIIFLYLAPIYGLVLAGKSGKNILSYTLKLTLVISVITIAIHGIFYAIDPSNYTPFHLVKKGSGIILGHFFWISLLALAVLAWLTIHTLKMNSEVSNIFIFWLWVALPMLLITISSLYLKNFNLTSYPFTYLGIQIPIIAAFYVIKSFSQISEVYIPDSR